MQTYLSTHVHCTQCDFYFVDAEARSEHVESSSSHPLCEPCSRRFLNENSLSFRHKCAAPHLPSKQSEEDLLDGNEVILNWAKDSINESLSYFPIMEDDYWSSESEDADSNSSSTSDSGNGDSDDETEYHNEHVILLVEAEPGLRYHELVSENFDNSSEISAPCYCPGIVKSEVMTSA